GSPFFGLELARAMLRRQPGGDLDDALPFPSNVANLLGERMGRMSSSARAVLVVAAALRHPTRMLLTDAVGDAEGVASALWEGSSVGVIDLDNEQLRFTHPLFPSILYSTTPAEQRRGVHRRLAEVVSDAEERARHLALGAPDRDPDIARVLDEGAARARARGAPDAAAELAGL